MTAPTPQQLVDVLRHFKSDRDRGFEGGTGTPVALISPSTIEIISESSNLRDLGVIQLVGGIEFPGLQRPADIISLLKTGPARPDLILLSDQILSSPDASVLVRTDEIDQYFSPIEAILNLKYGYRLAIWTISGYVAIEPYAPAISIVFQKLTQYLGDCESLGSHWNVRELQRLRLPAERHYRALRKVRHFRSAVLNGFRYSPNDPAGLALLQKADVLEQQANAQVGI